MDDNIVSVDSPFPLNLTEDNPWNFTIIGDTRQQLGVWNYSTNHYTHDNASNPIRAALVEKMKVLGNIQFY